MPSTTQPGGQRVIDVTRKGRTCENPLFAASLPASKQGEELCTPRTDNQRSRRGSCSSGVLGGISPPLVSATPDWTKILGANPDADDVTGIDPHMLPSIAPRDALLPAGSPTSPRGQNGTDPINGREWDTDDKDLQFACTFARCAQPRELRSAQRREVCRCDNDPNGGTPPRPAALPRRTARRRQIRAGRRIPTVARAPRREGPRRSRPRRLDLRRRPDRRLQAMARSSANALATRLSTVHGDRK